MKKIIISFFIFLMCCNFLVSKSFADWSSPFVVYNGNLYVVMDTKIEPNTIGKKIGEVTNYSDMEGTYNGNFSNQFPKGTEYYEIKGVDIKNAFAVKKIDNSFVRVNYNGKYGGAVNHNHWIKPILYLTGVIILIGILFFIFKKKKISKKDVI